jgi:hypothetical protein
MNCCDDLSTGLGMTPFITLRRKYSINDVSVQRVAKFYLGVIDRMIHGTFRHYRYSRRQHREQTHIAAKERNSGCLRRTKRVLESVDVYKSAIKVLKKVVVSLNANIPLEVLQTLTQYSVPELPSRIVDAAESSSSPIRSLRQSEVSASSDEDEQAPQVNDEDFLGVSPMVEATTDDVSYGLNSEGTTNEQQLSLDPTVADISSESSNFQETEGVPAERKTTQLRRSTRRKHHVEYHPLVYGSTLTEDTKEESFDINVTMSRSKRKKVALAKSS